MSSATIEIRPGGGLNWDLTSQDYANYRSGYPRSYFTLLRELGIGGSGQSILDLGAGTGALALEFARAGAQVTALDASQGQLEQLKKRAEQDSLDLNVHFSRAEQTGLPDASFDVISASMCWGYFEKESIIREVTRLLKPGGVLLISSLIWDHDDPVSLVTDELVAEFNPKSLQNNRGRFPSPIPEGIDPLATQKDVTDTAQNPLVLRGFYTYTEKLPYTRESWRGRIRASKWIGAALSESKAIEFDRLHDQALRTHFPESFEISHRITFHILEVLP